MKKVRILNIYNWAQKELEYILKRMAYVLKVFGKNVPSIIVVYYKKNLIDCQKLVLHKNFYFFPKWCC